jgi:hypothetical protein
MNMMLSKSLIDFIIAVSVGAVIGIGIGAVVKTALDTPDVWFSYSTDECVKVINYVEGENYSCENMPSKFNHVWVE